jgi:hypothetical protein
MNAYRLKMTPDELAEAARTEELFGPVDRARALYLEYKLVGHRSSVDCGEMIWALPGGGVASTRNLREIDSALVVNEPDRETIRRLKTPLAA